ncbi:MAG: hypothetical protein HY658_12885 [Actinobacteria bacterium]|nr:hypothetical protein [Actinomycetota bacterium]
MSRPPRRSLALVSLLGLVAAACGSEQAAFRDPLADRERRMVSQVADFLGDSGRGAAVAVDAEGNPHISYLGLEEPAVEGQPAAARPIGSPTPPAVMHAHLVGGVWTRSPVQEEARINEGSTTAIAVDADGVHHVIWTERPVGLAHASNAEGDFSEPARITNGPAAGISLASGEAGLWASWIERGVVRAASGGPGGWQVEDVASVSGGLEGLPVRTAVRVSADGPLVAYTDPGTNTPMIARRAADGTWTSEPVEGGGGGYAISLALDGEGNPHVAYYTSPRGGSAEVRHAHSVGGGPWEVSTVGQVAGEPVERSWGTGIAVDERGTHYVAWFAGAGDGVRFATNENGSFEDVPGTFGFDGVNPGVAAAPDGGVVYVVWYDADDLDVKLGAYGEQELVLARPGETTAPPPAQPTDGATGGAGCAEGSVQVTASPGAAVNGFDQDQVDAPAEAFTLCFDNADNGVPHNVHVFQSSTGPEGGDVAVTGVPEVGPVVQSADVPATEPGEYFFQCDAHPTTMTGTLTVA